MPLIVAGYQGNIKEDATIRFKITGVDSNGVPTGFTGTVNIIVYKDSGSGDITAGITITTSFDGFTGITDIAVDTSSDVVYTPNAEYFAVITGVSVDGNSVSGTVVASWAIEKRFVESTLTSTKIDAVLAQEQLHFDSSSTLIKRIFSDQRNQSQLIEETIKELKDIQSASQNPKGGLSGNI